MEHGHPILTAPNRNRRGSNAMRLTRFCTAIAAVLAVAGCVGVEPWQRGILAKPQMAMDPYPLQSALREHNYGSREAGMGGNAASGGGCGCN